MANPLLDRVLPADAADRSQVIEYKGKVGDFGRVAAIVRDDLDALEPADRPAAWRDAPVEIRLEFGWFDAAGDLPGVEGRIVADMALVCQRCLEAFRMPVDASFRMVFTAGDDEETQAGYDAWQLEEDTVRPLDFVEEAMVMAMPLAPVHESADECGPVAGQIAAGKPDTARPFADLRARMEASKEQ